TVKDSTDSYVQKFAKSFDLEIYGNHLSVHGVAGTFRYTIISVNGSHKFSGYFRKDLDLSVLPVGIYAIKVESPSGVINIIRFAKK
ncbi:MAG: hypothetical protein IIT53_02420, partial [Fibrobacter sp.]|nr:hypothetical protein [Fibrobacter sp.]